MQLPKHLLVVDVTVEPDVEAEWNEWYNKVHLPQIVSCPGFRYAARYISEIEGSRHYLTIYELEGPEALKAREFAERRGWGRFEKKVSASVRIYRQVTALESMGDGSREC